MVWAFAGCIWFGALARAAHDYWASVLMWGLLSGLSVFTLVRHTRTGKPLQLPLLIPWLATLAAVWLSAIHSWDKTSTFWDAWGWTYVVITFYLIVNVIETNEEEHEFLTRAGMVVVPLTLFACYQQWTGTPQGFAEFYFIAGRLPLRWGHWEIHSTLINAAVFSGFMASWALFWFSRRKEGVVAWTALIASLIGVTLARSWIAWGALAGGALCYHAWALSGVVRRRFLSIGAAGLFLAAFVALGVKSFHVKQIDAHPGSYQPMGRTLYWKAAWHMFRDNPWTGVGWSGFASAYPAYRAGHGEGSLFTHSYPLKIAAETGLPGCLAFGGLLVAFLRRRPWTHRLAGSTLCVMAVMSAVTIYMNYLLCEMLMAIWMALALRQRNSTERAVVLRPLWTLVAIVTLITFSSYWLRLFQAERLFAAGDYKGALQLNAYHASSPLALQQHPSR